MKETHKLFNINKDTALKSTSWFLSIFLILILLLFLGYKSLSVFSKINPTPPSLRNGLTGLAMCSTSDEILANKTSVAHSGTVNTPVGNNISGLKKWSAGSTWGGSVPQSGDVVTIPSNSVVVIDQNVNVKSIKVEGKLIVDLSKNVTVSVEYLYLTGPNAYFEWGTESNPYTKDGLITLRGGNDNTKIPGTTINYKAIVAANRARLELHGNDNKQSWSRLGANAGANQNKITMKDANTNWEVGDEVLIVSSRRSWNEAEKRRITAVSGDKRTFTLNSNLNHPHIGKKFTYTRSTDGKSWTSEMRAEVGLLSKSIRIEGDNGGTDFGGHIMIHSDGVAHVEDVELYRMGQKKNIGRYPFHWHLLEEKGAGQYLKNTSIHTSFNRAITIHGTESTIVEGNFAYDHIGHGLFLEDGSERFNTIKNNVMVLTKRPKAGEQHTPSDNEMNEVQNRTPSQFWITNPNNTFEGNVAAGSQGTGFWFAMPTKPMQQSSVIERFANIQPHKEKLGKFSGNSSHSCENGFDLFDRLSASHAILRNQSWDRTDKRYIDKHTFYACGLANYAGIGGGRARTESVIFRDNVYSDNVTSLMHANYTTIENSVFIANCGENVFSGERKLNRGYDGACTLTDCHLVGWDAGNANYVQNTGGAQKHVNYRIEGITLSPDKSVRMNFPNYSGIPKGGVGANAVAHPRFWSYVHWDKDGSLSGKANTSIITNHPLCRDGTEVRYANWTNLFRTDRRFAYMLAIGEGKPKMTLIRTKSGTPKAGQYYVNDDNGSPNGFYGTFIHFPVMVNDGFLYTMQFEKLSTNKRVTLHMKDAYTSGDEVLYKVKDFGRLGGINVSNASKKTSLNDVKSSGSTAWAKVGNDIYIKMKVGNNPDINCVISWSTNVTLPKLDSDGDGKSDYQESKDGTDPVGNGNIPDAKVIPWVPNNNTSTNLPPTGLFEEPTFSTIEEGYDDLYFRVAASDPNPGDNITLTLFIDGIEKRSESGFPYEWGHTSGNPATKLETLDLGPGDHEFKVVIADDKGASSTIMKVITVTEVKGPYSGFPISIPGVLQLEDYDKGGQGIGYFDVSDGNNGGGYRNDNVDISPEGTGFIVGWISTGEWLEYTVDIDETGSYDFEFNTSSLNGGGEFDITLDGVDVLTGINVPKTGSWDQYEKFNEVMNLSSGEHLLRVNIGNGGFNLDQIEITKANITNVSNSIASSVTIFPNPSETGIFNLSVVADWQVFTMKGEMISEGISDKVDLSNSPKGTYFIKHENNVLMLIR